jgi:hypothetical protein
MAITTLDGALAGMQPSRQVVKGLSGTLVAGRPFSFWGVAGNPGAGTYDTTLNGANCAASIAGRIPRNNPSSGNAHISRFSGLMVHSGVLMLCDRLWQNRIANATGAQSITQPTLPARSIGGDTNGDGILLGMELSTGSTANTPTAPVSYTNSTATGGTRTAALLDAFTATTGINSFLRYDLQAGDTGIRSISSINLSATPTGGVMNLVAYRQLAVIEVNANVPFVIDALTGGFPQLYNDTVPFLVFVPSTTTTTGISAGYTESHG